MLKPIYLVDLSLSFSHKTCFKDFSAAIYPGDRIGIIGANGVGKSTLLKMLAGRGDPTAGHITRPPSLSVGYVPQVVEDFPHLSGGQRINQCLSAALAGHPDCLLLDEPTNHLDANNRDALLRMLRSFSGTLVVVSHDLKLLRDVVDIIWHIDNGTVHVFKGSYDDYQNLQKQERRSLEKQAAHLKRQKHEAHQSLMREQERAKKSRLMGEKNRSSMAPIAAGRKLGNAQSTAARKKVAINEHKALVVSKLANLRVPEVIKPQFYLACADGGRGQILAISDGEVGYAKPLLSNINLSLFSQERLALVGKNGAGKTTLVKAILRHPDVKISGIWRMPKVLDIGYLDQHYETLNPELSVFATIADQRSDWSIAQVRKHLNDFLFRKNESVEALVATLSGGEKARLSLALIACSTPKLLILDEISNNLDLLAREHVQQVLRDFPAAMIVISHDEEFLNAIGIENRLHLGPGKK
jgi:ATPase subunit of ABC transporter with duplicated ATPase domains